MLSFREYLCELALQPRRWEFVVNPQDKQAAAMRLIGLVQTAYQQTHRGSYVNTTDDVLSSDWHVVNSGQERDIDATIFVRKARGQERWSGYKIQGVGHDGRSESKSLVMRKLDELLNTNGWWIEASGRMQEVLRARNVPTVTSVDTLQRLFNDPDLRMLQNGRYIRRLPEGRIVQEMVFGKPSV